MMQSELSEASAPANPKTGQRWVEIIALVGIILAVLLPRAFKLDQFVTPDEETWLMRSANFYMALAQRDPSHTYQKEHPGVTIMWAGTAAFLKAYPEYRGSGEGQVTTARFIYYLQNYFKVPPIEVLKTARFFVVLGVTLAVVIAFLYVRRIIGFLPALISFLLIAFDPYHLALTRLLHLDGLMSTLLFLSLVSFFGYQKDKRLVDLVISGVSAGLCWLTKSPGFFLGVAVGVIGLVVMWQRQRAEKEGWSVKFVWSCLWPVIAWGGIGAAVYVVLWPAMWVDPVGTLSNVLLQAEGYAEKGHAAALFFNGDVIPSGDLGLKYAYFYPLNYLWRTTPVVLGGLLLAGWGFIARREPFKDSLARLMVVGLLIFVVLFSLVMTLGLKKFDRYLLPIFLPLDLIAGMGWAFLAYRLLETTRTGLARWGVYLMLAAVVGVQIYLAASTFPYYFSYYNPLMGGPRKAPQVMLIGWGEGIDQAARYLNAKPNADNLNVYAWYSRGSFSYLFNGNTYYIDPNFGERQEDMDRLKAADYVVIYVHQWQRNIPPALLDYLSDKTAEKSFWINGIEYARVYKLR